MSALLYRLIGYGVTAAILAAQGGQPAESAVYLLKAGTRIPLSPINTVSTRNAAPGDQVYLETVFPILVSGKIVIPTGSYVQGTVTESKRPGEVKGRGALFLRFDTLILPNGVTRDFQSRPGGISGDNPGTLDRQEGKVVSDGAQTRDTLTVAGGAMYGAGMGWMIDGHGSGAGIGAGAGAAAGLMGVLLTRGPEAELKRGSVVQMVLDRDLQFTGEELPAGVAVTRPRAARGPQASSEGNEQRQKLPLPGRQLPNF